MTDEQLVYEMVCFLKEHGIKALMQNVLKAINKAEEID